MGHEINNNYKLVPYFLIMEKVTCSQLRLKLQEIKDLKREFDLEMGKISETKNIKQGKGVDRHIRKLIDELSDSMRLISKSYNYEMRRDISSLLNKADVIPRRSIEKQFLNIANEHDIDIKDAVVIYESFDNEGNILSNKVIFGEKYNGIYIRYYSKKNSMANIAQISFIDKNNEKLENRGWDETYEFQHGEWILEK